MRLRHICTIASTLLLFAGLATSADAKSKGKHHVARPSGGAEAPASAGGTAPSGTTGTTGATNPTAPLGDLAPIVLGPHQSPTAIYAGPIFQLTAAGLMPYASRSATATGATGATGGGTDAATTSSASGSNTTDNLTGASLPMLEVPGSTAEEVQVDGLGIAAAPENAPPAVQQVIWAGNRLIGLPYLWGGGHKNWISPGGYDCSGTVSFALHGGDLLATPLDSGQFERWGAPGQGQWMTILTNAGHAYLDVAGLRLDTSSENDPSNLQGPRWRPLRPGNPGFVKRHPVGF